MFAHNTLPYGPDLIGQASTFAITAPFHYFFVQLTGFVEGNLFVSYFLLTAGAVILPLSGNTWKDWKRSLCYGGIVFLSLSFLYTEPYWNMTVSYTHLDVYKRQAISAPPARSSTGCSGGS